MKLQSLEDKDRAEQELDAFRIEIRQFQNFISDQLGKFHSISDVARSRREKRELEKDQRKQRVQEKIASRIEKLNAEMEVCVQCVRGGVVCLVSGHSPVHAPPPPPS